MAGLAGWAGYWAHKHEDPAYVSPTAPVRATTTPPATLSPHGIRSSHHPSVKGKQRAGHMRTFVVRGKRHKAGRFGPSY